MNERTQKKAECNIFDLCDIVRETGFAIHKYHANGHLEKIYENALAHRLRKAGLDVKQQYALSVEDEDGTALGEYFADMLVEDCLIVELKACRSLAPEHKAQVLGYLRASNIDHGLLLNFGGSRFEVKKYIWSNAAASNRGWVRSAIALFGSVATLILKTVNM